MRILFSVNTTFQLFNACIIAYKQNNVEKVLLLNNSLFYNIELIKERLLSTKLFNQVHILPTKTDKENIIKEVELLNIFNADVFYFVSYASVASCYVYNKFQTLDKEIYYFEDGMGTYNLFTNYKSFRKDYLYLKKDCDFVNLTYVSKILVYNKDLYYSENKEKVENINYEYIFSNNDILEKLNFVYDYSFEEIKAKNIFFTQNFLAFNAVTQSDINNFFEKLRIQTGGNLILKLHPQDSPRYYKEMNIKVILGQVPWELILINHLKANAIKNKNLITICSTSLAYILMFFNKSLQDNNINCFFLWNLLPTPFDEYAKTFYKVFEDKLKIDILSLSTFDKLQQ